MSRSPLSDEQKRVLVTLYNASADGPTLRGLEARGLVMLIETASGRLHAVLTGDGFDAAIDAFLEQQR